MKKKHLPLIAVTMGDPSGIGPEIILKSFEKKVIRSNKIIVIGNYNVLHAVYNILKISSFDLKKINDINECLFNHNILNILDISTVNLDRLIPGKLQTMSGNAAFVSVKKAVELTRNNIIDAIVTAPLNKEALHMAGYNYPGHTEILADLTNTRDYAMLLHDKKLKVIHVSTHVSLLEAITGLRRERIEKVIEMGNNIMKKLCKNEPEIAVAGINPHSGENGLFGDEEKREILPAVKNMKKKGIKVEGPFPPDTVFLKALKKEYDLVVAMYHDQGHIPLKLVGFDSGVNITVGLPFIRTSVDHGTAFEIAWKGIASPNSMINAIKLAIKLAE